MKISVLQAALQVFGSGPYDAGISVDDAGLVLVTSEAARPSGPQRMRKLL
jgi:hypothetical protein